MRIALVTDGNSKTLQSNVQKGINQMGIFRDRSNHRVAWFFGILGVLAIGSGIAWLLSSTNHLASGSSERAFLLEVDYDKFRQIMVRNDVTREVITASGLTLKSDDLENLVVDTTQDRRPVINALLGRSKTELDATKHLTVSVKNAEVNLDTLELTQHAEIGNDLIHVRTVSDKPTGNLESYETSLKAKRISTGAEVVVTVQLKVNILLPRLFQSTAGARVQAEADKATKEQEAMLRDVVEKYSKRLTLILKN